LFHHVHFNKAATLMHNNIISRGLKDLDTLYSSNTNVIFKNLIEGYGFCDLLPCSCVSIYHSFGPNFCLNFSSGDR